MERQNKYMDSRVQGLWRILRRAGLEDKITIKHKKMKSERERERQTDRQTRHEDPAFSVLPVSFMCGINPRVKRKCIYTLHSAKIKKERNKETKKNLNKEVQEKFVVTNYQKAQLEIYALQWLSHFLEKKYPVGPYIYRSIYIHIQVCVHVYAQVQSNKSSEIERVYGRPCRIYKHGRCVCDAHIW